MPTLVPIVRFVAAAALSLLPVRDTSADTLDSEFRRRMKQFEHARAIRPIPPKGRARELNITDVEVREIQAAAANLLPESIVNIGPVTDGCPCEEGSKCTDQVWVIAVRGAETKGLLFSRINGSWGIGSTQRWWLDYAALQRRQRDFADRSEYRAAEAKLLDRMPICSAGK